MKCPKCKESIITIISMNRKPHHTVACTSRGSSSTYFPTSRKFRCENCNHKWQK